MRIYLSPAVADDRIAYRFDGEAITATMAGPPGPDGLPTDGPSDSFDLSGFPEGGEFDGAETTLPINPIISVTREAGVLAVVLLNPIGANASEAERWPEWQEV